MEIFKYNSTDPNGLFLDNGELVNGIVDAMWVERYRAGGEFKFTAPLENGLIEALPPDTIVSHAGTLEVMMVENATISEGLDKAATVEITGRSIETFLENRQVGSNMALVGGLWTSLIFSHVLAPSSTWQQAVDLINFYIEAGTLVDDDDQILGLIASAYSIPVETITEERVIKKGSVYKAVLELLEINDYGIKTMRPNGATDETTLRIHNGTDVSSDIVFSWDVGDLDNAEYLWSNKKYKNAALVIGKNQQTKVAPSGSSLSRRMMVIDAGDIEEDAYYDIGGPGETEVPALQVTRANETLAAQRMISITSVDISRTNRFKYRDDYDIGDIIMVDGNYGASQQMRVIEYVEIEDENGESGYPTLSLLNL